jgi:acetolactate synthase-1/2/3 large subunit
MNTWVLVADYLDHLGVDTVFGLPGDDMDLLPALEHGRTRFVVCRDQRNAVFMTVGHALARGDLAVCAIGKGPALTNALTGLLEASSAAVPLLLIATGTALPQVGTGAFQEVDQIRAVRPFTKWAARVDDAARLPAVLEKAVAIAVNGTPGPVYVEIAEQLADQDVSAPAWRPATVQRQAPDPAGLRETAALIAAADRPLLLVGGGVRHRNSDRLVERLAESLGAGMFTTASGRGSVDEDHPLFCGVAGLYTVEPTTRLWHETDLVIALGSRLEETATFGWPDAPAPPVLQVVAEASAISTARPGRHLIGDVDATVSGWLDLLNPRRTPWTERVKDIRAGLLRQAEQPTGTVARLLAALDAVLPADRILVQENGLQDMWSYFYPYFSCGRDGGSIVPSEQTPLGFGAAAAVGVRLALPDRPVVALVGDGAFNLFRSDLMTVADAGAAVLYVVLDNGGYGWLQTNLDRVSGPDSRFAFVTARPTGTAGIAAACGLGYARVDDPAELTDVLKKAWEQCRSGTATVVELSTALTDVPPGMGEAHGDFPVRDQGIEPGSTQRKSGETE